MKVAHLLRKYHPAEWGGTETALLGLVGPLRRRSVESVVFAPRIEACPHEDPLADAGCRLRRVKASMPIWGISEERRRQLVSLGGNLMSFDLIAKLWQEPDLDVIHAHATGRIGAIGRWVARRRGIPFVLTVHGGVYDVPEPLVQSYSSGGQGWEWGKLCGFFLNSRGLISDADLVLAGNGQAAASIRDRHPNQRVLSHPHGIATSAYRTDHRSDARAAFPRLADREILLVLGRIDPAKNQAWLVGEMPALLRRHPRLLLVFAGASTHSGYAEALTRQIEELGLQESVLVTGALPPGDPRLIGLTQSAQTVVLASLFESFGLVILEGWAAGAPVLATPTAGASHLIENGKTGMIFRLDQPEQFHSAIDALWGNPDLRGRLSAAGRRRVADFDSERLAASMLGWYEELSEKASRLGRARTPLGPLGSLSAAAPRVLP